jgi:ribulose-5-phosphate 4-epimerase/fuculose-1-phosphate aldolase
VSAPKADPAQARELVLANHILYQRGIVDAFGHVSVRSNARPEEFYLTRGIAPAIVTSGDVLVFGLDGEPLVNDGSDLYSERFIHAAIYASRPDVMGVVHSHSPAILPFTVTGVDLKPLTTMGSFLADGVGLYDPQGPVGDSNLLVQTLQLGRSLVAELGEKHVALMRGHGSTVVGRSVREAVSRAIYTEVNAKLQLEVMRMGVPVKYLTPGEARLLNAFTKPDVSRPWDLWVHELPETEQKRAIAK